MVEIRQAEEKIHRIEMLTAPASSARVRRRPTRARRPALGRWTRVGVAVRWMYSERPIAGGSPYVAGRRPAGGGPRSERRATRPPPLAHPAQPRGRRMDSKQMGGSLAMALVGDALTNRIAERIRTVPPRPVGGRRRPLVRHGRRAQLDDRLRPRRTHRRGLVGQGTGDRPDRHPVPDAQTSCIAGGTDRDGARCDQRACTRPAAGTEGRPRCRVPGRPPQRACTRALAARLIAPSGSPPSGS